jgi:hypothetical protein
MVNSELATGAKTESPVSCRKVGTTGTTLIWVALILIILSQSM